MKRLLKRSSFVVEIVRRSALGLSTSGIFLALQDAGVSAIGYEKVNQFEFAVESDVADTKEQSWDAAGTLRSAILSKTVSSESQPIAATRE